MTNVYIVKHKKHPHVSYTIYAHNIEMAKQIAANKYWTAYGDDPEETKKNLVAKRVYNIIKGQGE